MADRFHCALPPDESGRLILDGDEARHLIRVLRAARGDRVEVFDGQGRSFGAEVRELLRDRVILSVIEGPFEETSPACRLTLATAVPKGDRFDWLIEKATEIGVDRLVPLTTERSVVDPGSSKLDRLRRKVIEASKQCGRSRLMAIDAPRSLGEYLSACPDETRLIAHPGGQLAQQGPSGKSVAIAIGPEGGFSDPEIELAASSGWSMIDLGPNKLRVETAGIVASALVLAMTAPGGDS